jgi:predicted phage terminase large subunit-like protein
MAMRERPVLTELAFDRKVAELAQWAAEAVSPFKDRSSEAKKKRLARAAEDFAFFCQTYLPHYFRSAPAPFHGELLTMIDWRPDPAQGQAVVPVAVAAPRGFAKSTFVSMGYSLWQALQKRRNFIVIGSDTKDLAEDLVASIAVELMENPRIVYDYGRRLLSAKKADIALDDGRGCRILARGAGQQMRGLKHRARRPDLIVLDDLENDKSVKNPQRVEALLDWVISAVYPALDPAGSLFIIGTILSRRSALATMIHSPEEPYSHWTRRIYRAIQPDGSSLWPAEWPIKVIEAQRQTMGTIRFNKEKQNDPRDEEGLFREEWIKTYLPEDLSGKALAVAGFLDPSIGTGESADYKAVISVALDPAKYVYYVLDASIRRASLDQVMQAILARQRLWAYTLFGIEDNLFQKLLLGQLQQVATQAQITLPLRGVTHRLAKETRLAGLSPLVERGVVLFPAPEHRDADMRLLIEQLIYFPSTTMHDDGPDALEGAVGLLRGGGLQIW